MTYLDLAELSSVFNGRWLWSARRTAVARFRRADHFGDPTLPLDEAVRQLVREQTGRSLEGPICLLTNLAWVGYCFNPISLYFCFAADGRRLATLVAEVTNTPWAERHCYVLDAQGTTESSACEFQFTKQLHVSPFLPPNISYRLRVRGPARQLVVHLEAERGGEKLLDATLSLKQRAINGGGLARMLLRYPLLPQLTLARIHWQALKLWWTGHRVYPHQNHRHTSWELTRT